jgi:exopolyphosphatase/guanosine-5'-triphosphate,3'-diphosphate pyrophosphatase
MRSPGPQALCSKYVTAARLQWARMRIAAIDLGSNSFHMVIVDSGSGSFHVVDREKEMIRLGERTLSRGRLSAASMKRGLDTLRAPARAARA